MKTFFDMVVGKKQAPSPTKKSQSRRKTQRKKQPAKKFALSKEGKETEKRLVELVDADIEEHNKLSTFEIDKFLAGLVKELNPTIELPDFSKEPNKEPVNGRFFVLLFSLTIIHP